MQAQVFRNISNLAYLILGILTIVASQMWKPQSFEEQRFLIPPPPHIEFFSFGFQGVIADSLWVRTIQDFDYCENKISKNVCHGNSWMFQMLFAITNLSPDFIEAYREGGTSLSVLVSDSKGASIIFDKGVLLHPDDYNLASRAALHYLIEEKNRKKAADQYLHAAKLLGANGDWLYSLAARLYVDGGEKELAVQIYNQVKENGLDEGILKRMREKLGLPEDQ